MIITNLITIITLIIIISCSENETDKIPPTIFITSHADGAIVNEFDTIVVDVDDNFGIGMVEFQINGDGVSNDFSMPYIFAWNTLLYGDYETCTINAIAHDLAGNTASSDTIEITIDNRINLWGNYFLRDTTTIVDLSGNQYSGRISSDIAKLTNLEQLDLSSNQLSGSIPDEIFTLTTLKKIDFSHNNLTGILSNELVNLISLREFYIYDNFLTGELPNDIQLMSNLVEFRIQKNNFDGAISSEYCTMQSLNLFNALGNTNFSDNRFCPPYPICLNHYIGYQDTSACDR